MQLQIWDKNDLKRMTKPQERAERLRLMNRDKNKSKWETESNNRDEHEKRDEGKAKDGKVKEKTDRNSKRKKERERQACTYWGATLLQYLSMPFLKYSTASHLTFTSNMWLLKIFCGEKKNIDKCFLCIVLLPQVANGRQFKNCLSLMVCNSSDYREKL